MCFLMSLLQYNFIKNAQIINNKAVKLLIWQKKWL